MENIPLTLRERQLEYLRILKELDRFCTENELVYYMGCGTLIGAVRHKGFIPWDDDLDVFMPRPDFIRFNEIYKSDCFSFHSIYNDKTHPYNFGRLCSDRVFTLSRNENRFSFGIDVYVINGAPSTHSEQQTLIKETFRHIKRKTALCRYCSFLKKNNIRLYLLFELLMRRELWKAELKFSSFDFEKCEYIWPYGGGRLIMPKVNYGVPIRLPFEDGMFFAPEHFQEVLTLGYGDYMKLPPEDKRRPYHSGDFYWK